MVGSKSVKGKRLSLFHASCGSKENQLILNDEADEKKLDVFLNVGDQKVTSGPFNNFSGNILEVNLEKMEK